MVLYTITHKCNICGVNYKDEKVEDLRYNKEFLLSDILWRYSLVIL